jgi:CHAT domain-containing protein/tetratricopeptide (TPR) repeat protein
MRLILFFLLGIIISCPGISGSAERAASGRLIPGPSAEGFASGTTLIAATSSEGSASVRLVAGPSAEGASEKAERSFQEGVKKYRAGDVEGALRSWKLALDLFKSIPDSEFRQAQCHLNIGVACDELGLSGEAVVHHRAALDIFRNYDKTEYLQALCLMNLGVAEIGLGEHGNAAGSLNAAIAFLEGMPDTADLQAKCHLNLGVALSELGRNDEAMKEYRLALDLFKSLPDSSRQQAACFMNMASAYTGPDAEAKALESLDEALRLLSPLPGTEAEQAECLMNKGIALRRLRRLTEASQVLGQSQALDGKSRKSAVCMMNYGFVLEDMGRLEEALETFEKALAALRKFPGTEVYQGRCLTHAGITLSRLEKVEEAVRKYEEAMAVLDRIKGSDKDRAACLADMGVAAFQTGDLSRAMALHKEALSILRRLPGTEREQAYCFTNIGVVLRNLGRTDEAIGQYESALAVYRKLSGTEPMTAGCLWNLGEALGDAGRLEEAVRCGEEALAIFRGLPGAERETAGCLMNMAGALYNLGKIEDSVRCLEKALEMCANLSGTDWTRAACHINLGVAKGHIRNFEDALKSFNEALGILKKVRGSARQQAHCFLNLGSTFLEMGRLQEASSMLEKALAVFGSREGGEYDVALTLTNLGWVRNRGGEYGSALEVFRRALEYGDGWILRLGIADAYRGLAGPGEDGSRKDPPSDQALNEALASYRKTIDLIERERETIKAREYAVSWFNDRVKAYHSFISFVLDHEDLDFAASGLGRSLFEAAFSLSEGCRARMLCDLLQRRKPSAKDEATKKLLDEESELRLRIERLHEERESARTMVGDEGAVRRIGRINEEIREAQTRRNIVEGRLGSTGLFQLASSGKGEKPGQEALVDEGTAILEYTLLDKEIVLFILTKRDSHARRLPVTLKAPREYPSTAEERRKWFASMVERAEERPEEMGLEGLVHFYRFPMTNYSPLVRDDWAAHQKAGMALYRLLFPEDVQEYLRNRKISHLVIVPDGVLHYLPFSCLIAPSAPSEDYDVRYLVEDYALSILPSVSILGHLREQREERRKRSTPRRDFLAFADPVFAADDERIRSRGERRTDDAFATRYYAERFGLGRLPDTGDEAANIASLFPSGQSTVYLGFDASKQNALRDDVRDYRYILFATHGMMDEQNPDLSCIALSMPDPTKGGAMSGPTFLTMDKIFALELNADLVVLSACETALGRVARGEGMMGLPFAFFYAGTPSLLASVWKVPSRQTAVLSRSFFVSHKGGRNKAEALRDAQLQIIKPGGNVGEYAHPFFWAAFVLNGDWK